jgi:hypothetical protein
MVVLLGRGGQWFNLLSRKERLELLVLHSGCSGPNWERLLSLAKTYRGFELERVGFCSQLTASKTGKGQSKLQFG